MYHGNNTEENLLLVVITPTDTVILQPNISTSIPEDAFNRENLTQDKIFSEP